MCAHGFLEVLELIKSEYIICGDNVGISKSDLKNKVIKDTRSAGFYAFGKSRISNKNTVLIINGDYLPNIYTVLTEAWFQKTNLIVIALYNSIYDVETNYLDRCTVSNIMFIDRDYEQFKEKITSSLNLIGPKLFNIVTEVKTKKNDYTNILNELNKLVDSEDTIFIYNSDTTKLPCVVKNIEKKYKYGLFSKYLGYINTQDKNKQILISPVECLENDLNILNNKAMTNNFKVIVCGNIEHLRNWIEKNNINLVKCENIAKDIELLYNSNKPTILNIIRGGLLNVF